MCGGPRKRRSCYKCYAPGAGIRGKSQWTTFCKSWIYRVEMVVCTLVCAFLGHAGGSDKENGGEATQGMSEVSEAIFGSTPKVDSKGFGKLQLLCFPSHSPPPMPHHGAGRLTSSRVKGCAMLVEATKRPSRRTVAGKAV